MSQDSLKTCPNCKKKYINSFGKCEFCGTKYDTEIDNNTPKQSLNNRIFLGLSIALIVCALQYWYQSSYVNRTAAEQADMPSDIPALLLPPVQVALSPPQILIMNGCTLSKVASYVVTARILSTSHYWADPVANLAPVDLSLGWGLMADKRVIRQIWVINGGRWVYWFPPKNLYRYYPDKQLVESKQIYTNSANTHIIPANDRIRNTVKSLHRDQIVTLTGALVYVTLPNGVHWNTSLSRDDLGNGGCEIMYVEDLQIH